MPQPSRLIVAAALLTCAACSSPTESTPLTGLSALRAATIFAGITPLSTGTLPRSTDSSPTPCPKGGSVQGGFTFTGIDKPVIGRITFASCAVADSAGEVWTFTSQPVLTLTVDQVGTDSTYAAVTTMTGDLRVESRSARGTCTIDAREEVRYRFVTPTTSYIHQTGHVCGQVIDTTFIAPIPD